MSIRDDLAEVLASCELESRSLAGRLERADAVLAWLGQLDPDADPELIAWHLRTNADEIEQLRALTRWQEGDRVITTADTTGPAGTIPAGTTGTIHRAAEILVLFDGDDIPVFAFGPDGRDPGALAPHP